jgi:hypothetical protein
MTEPYVPVKGDWVRHPGWDEGETALVTAVGNRRLLASKMGLPEEMWYLHNRWIKVAAPKPLPGSWYAVTSLGILSGIKHSSAQRALEYLSSQGPGSVIAALGLFTDADGKDHAEIIRAES